MPKEYFESPLTKVGGSLRFPKLPGRQTTTDTNDPFDPGLGAIDVVPTSISTVPRPSTIAASAAPPAPAIAARPSLPNAVGESVPDTSGAVSRLRGVDQFKDQGYYLPEQGRSGPLPKGVTLSPSSFQRDPRLTDTTPEQNQAILFGRPAPAGNIAQGPNTQRLVTPEAIQRLTASGNMDEASARNYLLQNGFTDQAMQPAQPVSGNSNLEYSNIARPPQYPVGSIGGFIGALGKEARARNTPNMALQQQGLALGKLNIAEKQKLTDLKNEYDGLNDTNDPDGARRAEIEQRLALNSGKLKTDFTTEKMNAAKAILSNPFGSSPEDTAKATAFLSGQLDSANRGRVARNTGASPNTNLPPGMTRQVGTSGGKPVYEDAGGKRFVAR